MKTLIPVEHRILDSARSFDDAVAALCAATGNVEGRFEAIKAAAANAASFEAAVRAQEGPSGFMRFLTVDHGRWFDKFRIEGRSILYVIGNPLIARTMIQHDISVGLYVPVRLVIEQKPSEAVKIAYDVPSTLMSVFGNPKVMEAAAKLDAKLSALAGYIAGCRQG